MDLRDLMVQKRMVLITGAIAKKGLPCMPSNK
jgi:hypothetical protein